MDGKGVGVPGGLVADDGVEDGEELVHAGDECDLLGFALGHQPVVEGPDDRIGAKAATVGPSTGSGRTVAFLGAGNHKGCPYGPARAGRRPSARCGSR